jgi:hypothetical protein
MFYYGIFASFSTSGITQAVNHSPRIEKTALIFSGLTQRNLPEHIKTYMADGLSP